MSTISAVILTRNEEKNIEKCIKSLDFVNEIIVIDDFSEDKTPQIARGNKVKLLKHSLDNNFSAQRNFGLKKAFSKWVLFIDADEIVTSDLKKEILQNVHLETHKAFYLVRQAVFMGKVMRAGEWGRKKLIRLAKRGSGKWIRAVHEYWDIKGDVGILRSPLLHYPHSTLSELVASLNFYSTIHAAEHYKSGVSANLFKIIFYPVFKFIDDFIFKEGFRDGVYGFVFSLMMSFHSFLAWSKLYTKNKAKK